jgi:hypothetical protein
MKKLFILNIILLSLINNAFSQSEKNIDLIITINDQLIIGDIMHMQIAPSDGVKFKNNTDAKYHPGRLTLSDSVYNSIPDSGRVYLMFDYYDNSKSNVTVSNYKIELQKRWLESSYLVLEIFDLNSKKYKGVFYPLSKDQNYTFAIVSPNYHFERIARRKLKE